MLSKQLTSKLKEEQERENQQNPSHLNVAQCDRLIRTVSCKHDTNHAIRKANINVLQSFEEIKLYSVPSPPKPPPTSLSDDESTTMNGIDNNNINNRNSGNSHSSSSPASSQQQRQSRRGGTNSLASKFSSPGHNQYQQHTQHAVSKSPVPNVVSASTGGTSSSDVVEINLKDLLDQIVAHVNKNTNVTEWFKLSVSPSPASTTTVEQHNQQYHPSEFGADDLENVPPSAEQSQDLFESIENALAHIDFNLKRNSDFINELTKLLDTSRAIQQEKQLKKLLKALEDEKANQTSTNLSTVGSQSQPASPNLRAAGGGAATLDEKQLEEQRKKQKSKSFKGFGSFKVRSSSKENRDQSSANNQTDAKSSSNHLGLPPANAAAAAAAAAAAVSSTAVNNQQQAQKNWSSASQLNVTANELQNQLKLTQVQNHEISNSDYMELEIEVEKISYHLETLSRVWSKLSKARSNANSSLQGVTASNISQQQALKFSLEFQSLLGTLNANSLVKELEQSLFKLNWLITSKCGFSEPNWQSTVLSLTPSTIDSFIGVNLLKNYYRYVKYDFVSYKLFTRQLQLIQICAVILHLVCNILGFYKEMTGGCVESARIENAAVANNLGLLGDSNQALCAFNFSADKFRPISWSANHVTLYNVQATTPDPSLNPTMGSKSYVYRATNLSRSSSSRRGGETTNHSNVNLGRDEQLRQVKSELFMNDLDEFVAQSTLRLNIQASLANRTGYFYIVNQSTGLVLQAVDFTSEFSSLREQIESNQKRIQSSSLKATAAGVRIGGAATARLPSSVTKGPRFFLMPKLSSSASSPTAASPPPPNAAAAATAAAATSSSLSVETAHDEQLFYYYLINGCIANKVIRSGYCMAASSLNPKSPVTFWPNVKTTNCSWYFNHHEQTIVSGLSDDLVLDYMIIDEPPNQRYAVIIDTRVPNKASQKWTFEFN